MKVVFFDGYCNLCNGFVDWLVQIDSAGQLKFSSLQGETARKLLGEITGTTDPDTVIFFKENQRLERSAAVLHILKDLGGFWAVSQIFFLVPKFVRDFLYRTVAKNRYRIFGRRNTCRVPTLEEQNRFLP
jgi:predicted DCC family thiol-disulfide oxidoreductase YuxK